LALVTGRRPSASGGAFPRPKSMFLESASSRCALHSRFRASRPATKARPRPQRLTPRQTTREAA
jgi:hypothetical protein